jgi:hypothetical protein
MVSKAWKIFILETRPCSNMLSFICDIALNVFFSVLAVLKSCLRLLIIDVECAEFKTGAPKIERKQNNTLQIYN